MGVVVHFLQRCHWTRSSGSSAKLQFPSFNKQLLLSDPSTPQHIPQLIECILRCFKKFLPSYAHCHIDIAQTFCSSWRKCRKPGQRCCTRQWKMFYTTASQFSFSVIVRSWPENWPIYRGITLIPSLSWDALCILSNDEYKDHNALITIKKHVNLTNVGCIQLSTADGTQKNNLKNTAESNVTSCMSKTTENTLAILPLLSP